MSLPTRRERQQNDIQRKYSRDTVYENREKEDVPSKNIKQSSSFTLTIPGIPSPLQLPLSPHRVSFSSSYKSNRLIDPLLPIEEYRSQQRFNLEQWEEETPWSLSGDNELLLSFDCWFALATGPRHI